MNRIDTVFGKLKGDGRTAVVPYICCGDPYADATADIMLALAQGGADVIELGVPFSDPIADGPVNQRAAVRALAAGTKLSAILQLVARHRDKLGIPIVLFTYFNPIHARGVERFAEQAAASGVDGVLCVDLPPDEGEREFIPAMREQGVDTIFLLAPTSTRDRVNKVAACSSGFIYYVSRTGVTGERAALPSELVRDIKKLRKRLGQPLAVGFGLSTPEQVAAVGEIADGVVVGSALVRLIEEQGSDPGFPRVLEERVRELSAPLRQRAERRRA